MIRPEIIFRPAFPDELPRTAALCPASQASRGLTSPQCFVAVNERPIERLVGAAFWREIPSEPTVEFDWGMIAAYAGSDCEQDFFNHLIAQVGASGSAATELAAAPWLRANSRAAATLLRAGFHEHARRGHFQIDLAVLLDHFAAGPHAKPDLPGGGCVASLEPGHFDALRELLCLGPGSLRPAELEHGLKTAATQSPSLCDVRSSGVVWKDGQIAAACLADFRAGEIKLSALGAKPGSESAYGPLLRHAVAGAGFSGQPACATFQLDSRQPQGPLAALSIAAGVRTLGSFSQFSRPLRP